MDTTIDDPLLGALVDERYRIRARVARNGMATMYTATDERLGRPVAFKIIHSAQAQDPRFVGRFTGEAETIARLTHPNVVAVYDQGTYQGLPYLVMEYVKGRTLRELLIERGRLQPSDALVVLEQMLAAIAAAHRIGLVHRDVKPENVLVAEAPGGSNSLVDGVIKVADFGLARAVEVSAAGAGQLMATAAYVAPELVSQGHADPRTDVYSAGIVLFEMLTGRVPYDAPTVIDVAWKHVQEDVPPPSGFVPELPPVLDHLVARAASRDPAGRPTDAGTMHAEVQQIREELGAALARSQAVGEHTVVVSQVEANTATALLRPVSGSRHSADRPGWARLPHPRQSEPGAPRPHRRAAASSRGTGAREAITPMISKFNADPKTRIVAISAVAILGILLSAGIWWIGVGRYATAPTLTGLPKDQAVAQAEQAGFTLKFDVPRFDKQVAKDSVLQQDPAAGARITSGGVITVVLSKGPERYEVPDVSGKPFELAEQDLQQIGLTVVRTDQYDDNLAEGSVVSTEPAAGEAIKRGDTITVQVSKGRAPITVPNVVGKNVNEAKSTLARLGLTVELQKEEADLPKDQVVTQDPLDGSGAEPGDTVTLTVSSGPPLVTVPDVRNLSAEDASKALQAVGLQPQVMGGGTVRMQDPQPGSQVESGTQVRLLAFG